MNFLAVKNMAEELEKKGFRRFNPQEPLGKGEASYKFFITNNDSSIYAFQIGKMTLADAGFHMICAHCDSPTFRIKPNAEMTLRGRYRETEYRGLWRSDYVNLVLDGPLTLAGRVIKKDGGCDAS